MITRSNADGFLPFFLSHRLDCRPDEVTSTTGHRVPEGNSGCPPALLSLTGPKLDRRPDDSTRGGQTSSLRVEVEDVAHSEAVIFLDTRKAGQPGRISVATETGFAFSIAHTFSCASATPGRGPGSLRQMPPCCFAYGEREQLRV